MIKINTILWNNKQTILVQPYLPPFWHSMNSIPSDVWHWWKSAHALKRQRKRWRDAYIPTIWEKAYVKFCYNTISSMNYLNNRFAHRIEPISISCMKEKNCMHSDQKFLCILGRYIAQKYELIVVTNGNGQ